MTLPRLAIPFPRSGVLRHAGLAHRPPDLMGRGRDLAVVRAFLHELSNQGGSLLLSGEPGVGKSALLDAADEIAVTAGTRVLRAAGAESEVASFSGLNQLLLPLRDDFSRLDALQRNVLDAALGFSDGDAADRLVLHNAVLALLGQAGADRPLLLIVDNLHWLDQASAQVLGFVARRLSGSRVGLLTAKRTEASGPTDADAPRYELMPLDDDAATRLVVDRFPDLAPAVRQRIMTEARGNPLALLELPAKLTDLQRSARAALPAILPLTRRLRAALIPRVEALPAADRQLLLMAALDGTADLNLLREATATVTAGQRVIDDLAAAEQAGLVEVDEATHQVVFSHPLIRSAVAGLSSSSDVRRAHLALAARLRDQPERRAWHLAAATTAPNEAVASQLEQAARQVRARGDVSQAVAALIRAAQLSPHHHDRSRRLAEAAALSATMTGELAMVPQLLAEARHAAALEPNGSLGQDASLHVAVAEAWLMLNAADDIDAVHRLLTGAIGAAATIDSRPAGQQAPSAALVVALQTLLVVCAAGGRAELWQPVETALAGLDDCPELELLARTHADPARSVVGILGQLDSAIADLSRSTEQWRVLVLGAAAAGADRLAGCREALWHAAHDSDDSGATMNAISAMTLLCHDGFMTGAWDESWQMAEECLRACQRHGLPARAWMVREHLAMIAAARGDDAVMQELTGEMLQWAIPRAVTLTRLSVRRAAALSALGRGDFEEAYREAIAISPPGVLASHVPHALWTVMDLVEAAVRTGRIGEAADHVAAAQDARIAEISPRLALLVTASAALVAPAGEATQIFERALRIHGADHWPFEFARVQLAFGEHLRRVRASSDARAHLGAALVTFRTLRARPWSERAANELRAARLTPTRVETSRAPALTAQEHQIVTLAAAGLSNKQIGQRLYLSPRTVGSHLYRVFPKLGVSSRAGLRDALLALGSGDSASKFRRSSHGLAAAANDAWR
jgi:DNA-binding CsgD family transcriptional regulator